ncbi:unnamed protein product [Camellia sinensis]
MIMGLVLRGHDLKHIQLNSIGWIIVKEKCFSCGQVTNFFSFSFGAGKLIRFISHLSSFHVNIRNGVKNKWNSLYCLAGIARHAALEEEAPVLFKGIGHSLNSANNLVRKIG